MVIAHHLMWTLYGWWLPNDPRGSTSRAIASDVLAQLGELHFGRKKVQPASREIRAFYAQAATLLKHGLLSFRPDEFERVAETFAEGLRACGYTCYALAIMPDHVHLIIRKHRDLAEAMIANLQGFTRSRLAEIGLRPTDHPTWTQGGWKVFLDTPDDVRRAIRYIEQNPVKIGLSPQQCPAVKPYDGWPFYAPR